MYKDIAEAYEDVLSGELSINNFDSLKVYFQAVKEPAEDILVLDDWCYDEDEDLCLMVYHHPTKITRKEIYQQYCEKDLHGLTNLTHGDLIDCYGHILTADEIREIFWNMGN